MTERFEFSINSNGQVDIIDKVESKEKNAICIYNDLGVPPFSSAKAVCDLLNEQDVRIKELESENKMLKTTISRNEAYIKRITTKGKWSNTGDVDD